MLPLSDPANGTWVKDRLGFYNCPFPNCSKSNVKGWALKTHLLTLKGSGGDRTHLLDDPLWKLWGRTEDPWDPLYINRPVLANERTQIRSDPVPGLLVDTLGGFRVEIAVTRSESDLDRSG